MFIVRSARTPHRRRGGYAFVTAIGVMAVLFILAFAVAGAVGRNRASRRDWQESTRAMELSGAIARWAAREGAAPGEKRFDLESVQRFVEVSNAGPDLPAFSAGGLKRLPGDLLVQVALTAESAEVDSSPWVWLINLQSSPRRALLLQRGADQRQ